MKIYVLWDEDETIDYDLTDCTAHARKELWDGPDFIYKHVVVYASNPVSRFCVSAMATTLDRNPHADAVYGTKCVSPWNHTGSILETTIRTALSYTTRFINDTRIPFKYDNAIPVMTRAYAQTIPDPLDSVIVREQFSQTYVDVDPLYVLPTETYYSLLFVYPDAAFALWDFHTIPLFYFCLGFAIFSQDHLLLVPFFLWCGTHAIYLCMECHLLYAFVLNTIFPTRLVAYFRHTLAKSKTFHGT
jgi:hypothetical protein